MGKSACNEGKAVGIGCIQSTLCEGPNSDKLDPSECCAKYEIVRPYSVSLVLREYVLIFIVISKLIIGKLIANLP